MTHVKGLLCGVKVEWRRADWLPRDNILCDVCLMG